MIVQGGKAAAEQFTKTIKKEADHAIDCMLKTKSIAELFGIMMSLGTRLQCMAAISLEGSFGTKIPHEVLNKAYDECKAELFKEHDLTQEQLERNFRHLNELQKEAKGHA